MHRRLIPAAVAALALAAAPATGAKEISRAEVCGTAGACQTVDDEGSRMQLMTASGRSIPPPPEAPYYDVRAEYRHGDQSQWVSYVAVPRHDAVRYQDGAWYEMTAEQAALIGKATAGAEPYPAAGLVGAAPPADPKPAAAASGDGSLLWPWGVLLAIALAAAGATAAARTATHGWRRRGPAAP
jgi:hypothetical protein